MTTSTSPKASADSCPAAHLAPDPLTHDALQRRLDEAVARYNVPQFADDDPVLFPRSFTALPDIEIAALLCATIAWGNRKMIVRDCRRLMEMMDWQPYHFLRERAYEELPEGNIHRTFFVRNLKAYLRGLHDIYRRHGSLQQMVASTAIPASDAPAWEIAAAINTAISGANGGVADSRCLPLNLSATALKRLNMALRWLVRNDGIVDIGCWDVITPAQLYIPMDVHVGRTARSLGLLSRTATDRKAAIALTEELRRFRPDDPVAYDFALFGLGINPQAAESPC